jgi:class 3 adenylate cyclase
MSERPGDRTDPLGQSGLESVWPLLLSGGALAGAGVTTWLLMSAPVPLSQRLLAGAGLLAGYGLGLGGLWLRQRQHLQRAVRHQQEAEPMIRQFAAGVWRPDLPTERREVTVLCAWLAGPRSELPHTARSLAAMTTVLHDHRAAVIFDGTSGVVAVFNALGDEPDHVGRALGAARAVQLALQGQDTELVLGMHCGPATVGLLQRPDHPIYAVLGEPPEVARRLQVLGHPGELLISESAARQARVRTKHAEESGGLRFVRLVSRHLQPDATDPRSDDG